jgi:hypothetical protein
VPIINIAQTDHRLPAQCSGRTEGITWSLTYRTYLGPTTDLNPTNWVTSKITRDANVRNCAAEDGAGAAESDANYKINPVPQMGSIETTQGAKGAAFFVAFPETDHGQSRIHVWTARWDAGTNTLGKWHGSTVPVEPRSSGELNQWRPTLALTRTPDLGVVLAVQWMETEFAKGHGNNPPTRPRAAFAVVPDSDEAGTKRLVWKSLVTDLMPPENGSPATFRYSPFGHGVDYSGSASISPKSGGKFPKGGFLFTWVARRKDGDPATTLFARSVGFPGLR